MIDRFQRAINRLFDSLNRRWEHGRVRRRVALVLIASFAVALVAIEFSRQGWLPPRLAAVVPTNHFYAVDVAFTLFLVAEVISLVFGLASSVADAAGKQFEIFSLILLRQSFKELASFSEPIAWAELSGPVLRILIDAGGALAIFAVIGYYYRLQRHRRITADETEQYRFVTAKKGLSLLLLAIFSGVGLYAGVDLLVHGEIFPFFDVFYTVLIFSDVLIVLVSLRYSTTYHVVFRNSGFAVATVMIRLALAGPPYLNAALGLLAALFAVGLTAAYNFSAPVLDKVPDSAAEATPPADRAA